MTLHQTILLLFCVLVFSMMIGGYYGTIDWRIRKDLPLVTYNCYCPVCNHVLSQAHQIPVLSWLFLGGKCAYCKSAIPVRYPLLELSFILFYLITFCIFFNNPLIYLSAWCIYITLFVFLRCKGHFFSKFKGIMIMYGYHLLIGIILYAITSK